MEGSILDGITIGGAGGAIAGLTVWLAQLLQNTILKERDKRRAYEWLQKNTADNAGERFRTTRVIASWTNMTEDRVRYICSVHPSIFLCTDGEDQWGLFEHTPESVYEERGLLSV